MNLWLDVELAESYKSKSQKARVMTEAWVRQNAFCPKCLGDLIQYPNNAPVADFFCRCGKDFELKSKSGNAGSKIIDGAYETMIERIQSSNNPDFFFLNYDLNQKVKNFFVIPNFFFIPEIIEGRKPLPPQAKRAGWVGCNILLDLIPQSGKIYYIRDYGVIDRSDVLSQYQQVSFVEGEKSKGWIFEVMQCIDELQSKNFALSDLYAFENKLRKKFPNNQNIKEKIRQQLQFLRNKDYLEFLGAGNYRLK